jgi:hypothetical protein
VRRHGRFMHLARSPGMESVGVHRSGNQHRHRLSLAARDSSVDDSWCRASRYVLDRLPR